MAVTLQQIRELTVRARSEGVDRLARDLNAVAEAGKKVSATGDGVTRSEEEVAKSMLSAARAANVVVREVDAVARAQQDLEKRQLVVMRAINQGAMTHDQAARTLALLDAKYAQVGNTTTKVTAAHLAHAEAAGLNRMQLQMLQSAASNSFSSIASGAPIMMVAAQQGADLVQAFSMGPNGVGGTFAALGRGALALITPLTLAAAAVATASGVGLYGFARWRSEADALGHSLEGIGRRSGETRDNLAALAARGATAGGLSQSTGRDLAATYAGAGLGGATAEGAISVTRRYARVLQVDVDAAGKSLAAAFADPTKGLATLNEQLGFADAKTRLWIEGMQGSGDMLGAQRALLAALAKDLEAAEDRTSKLAKAWEWVKRTASDAAASTGQTVDRVISGPTDAERMNEMISQRQKLAALMVTSSDRFYDPDRADSFNAGLLHDLAATESEIEALERRLDRASRAAVGKGADQRLNQQSEAAWRDVNGVLPELERRRALDQEVARLEAAMNNPFLLDKMGVSARDLATALDGVKVAAAGVMPLMERMRYEGDLALRSIQARSVAERASLAYDQSFAGRRRGEIDPAAEIRADIERRKVVEQATRDAEERLRAANDSRALAGLPSYQRQREEIERQFRRQNELDTGSPAALAKNASARSAALEALSRNTISGPLDEANRALDSQNRLLAVNIATFGQSTDKVVAARTAQEMLNRYIEQGVPITEQMRRQVEDYARSFGKLALAEEEAEKRQRRVVEGMDDLRSTSSSVFSAILHGKGADVGRIVSDKLIDQASNNLSEILLGPKGKPGGGLFGGFFGGLFGGGAGGSIATADIAAGVVNLSGGLGVGGGAGGLFGGSGTGAPSTASGIPLPRPSPLTTPTAGGLPLALGSNYRGDGVDPRLTDIMTKAGAASSYDVKMISGLRPGDPRFHGQGLATDIQLFDRTTGKALPNYQDASSFRQYEQFAQTARGIQMRDYPELADQFRWGGYFGGPKGKYGAMDTMHFDLGGGRVGMGGGSWEKGLTPEQLGYFPGAQSVGMGQAGAATAALDRFADQTRDATGNLGGFGDGLARFTDGLGSGGGGGGGLFGSLLKLFGFADGGVFSSGLVPFASGGVFGAPTLFAMGGGRTGVLGEAGPEAIMPLSRGSDGRLGVRASIAGSRPSAPGGAAVAVPVTINNYAGAQVSARPKVGAGGQRQIEVTIRQIKREIAEEYGLSPVVGRR